MEAVLEESCKSSAGMKVAADGTIRLPAGCELLTKLYANHGVRIRMVRRQKIPTVRQLIDQLSRKHDQMLADELEARFRPRSR
ncbi:hypothetical protein BaRGS_00007549 [Batillaria attramentaria]|uniref:Uncharacterized protein n=1 Tax=Batillaria attramentaria TaxID=370345 RepID=A0ABD0LN63_9CAEN